MAQDDFKPSSGASATPGAPARKRHAALVFRQAGKHGVRALRQSGHISPATPKRGMGAGVRAAAGLMAPGTRRVIVKARYTRIVGGDLGAARAHIKYIVRDGVTREGAPGRLYDANGDEADGSAFLDRSEKDPHQFRFIVSADEDSARLADLKPFIRDLLSQMERDLDTKLDWVAVDHFNTGHPHTHIVIRGATTRNGEDLVMARDYIAHGVRARAQALITLELGPETELERVQKLFNEVGQERLTRLDRSLHGPSQGRHPGGIAPPRRRTPCSRPCGSAASRPWSASASPRSGSRACGSSMAELESKLRQLGERADKFKMMQRALKEAGIDRAAASMALFERGPRKAPLIGKVIGVGMVDEITDRTWVVVDAVDGRVHYADLGRLEPGELPAPGHAGGACRRQPCRRSRRSIPRLQVLSAGRARSGMPPMTGRPGSIRPSSPSGARTLRRGDLRRRSTAPSPSAAAGWLHASSPRPVRLDDVAPKPDMMRRLRQRETAAPGRGPVAPAQRVLRAAEPGSQIAGVYERSITTPTGKLAVIRRQDTFTLAPWRPGLEPFKGRAVMGMIGPNRVIWALDRGRALPARS